MNTQNTIQDELKSLGSSLPVTVSPSFSVPEGYFEGLATAILAKVNDSQAATPEAELIELSPLLAGISKVMPYSVPSIYFKQNLDAAAGMATETDSAVLATIGKKIPYRVPQDYFENLPGQLLARVITPETKVVPIFRRTWMQVAAAAAVCSALVFGGLRLMNDRANSNLVAEVTKTPAQAAQPQTASTEPVLEKEIKQASTKELEEFIETVEATTSGQELKKEMTFSAKAEVAELLKDVSENEMESFLSALPSAADELPATNEP